MNDYVSKPVRIEELQAAIERSLSAVKGEKRKLVVLPEMPAITKPRAAEPKPQRNRGTEQLRGQKEIES